MAAAIIDHYAGQPTAPLLVAKAHIYLYIWTVGSGGGPLVLLM